jgi:hypothetical protein
LHAGEVGAFDLGAHGRAGVEIKVVLLGFALGIVAGGIGVMLDVQSTCGQSRMASDDARDDGDDLRSLPD